MLSASTAGALDIVACGQIVPDGGIDVDMNGHAIVARRIAVDCGYDVGLPRGTVRGHGIAPSGVGDLSGGDYGITGSPRRVFVSDVAVHDVAIHGISVNQKLDVTNVTAQRAGVCQLD